MKSVALNAFHRLLGRRPGAKRLRAAGRIPAVIYGRQTEPKNLEIDRIELKELIHRSVSENLLLDLSVPEDARPKRLALVQQLLTIRRREIVPRLAGAAFIFFHVTARQNPVAAAGA